MRMAVEQSPTAAATRVMEPSAHVADREDAGHAAIARVMSGRMLAPR